MLSSPEMELDEEETGPERGRHWPSPQATLVPPHVGLGNDGRSPSRVPRQPVWRNTNWHTRETSRGALQVGPGWASADSSVLGGRESGRVRGTLGHWWE